MSPASCYAFLGLGVEFYGEETTLESFKMISVFTGMLWPAFWRVRFLLSMQYHFLEFRVGLGVLFGT